MSICGRVARSPDAVPRLDRMLRAIESGGHGVRHWGDGGARIGAADGASLATGAGQRVVVVDGRLDNGVELQAELGTAAATPAALALAAYDRWGPDFVDRLIGDLAIALWDGTGRRLLLATDPGELRPLFWTDVGDELRFASDYAGIWAEPGIGRAIDEDRIAEWLVLAPPVPGRTFYHGIQRVPGGHLLVWDDGRLRTRRWWRPEDRPMLRLADADYPVVVREALETAVACRVAGDARIGSHLSGGLDSGGVTAIAAQQLAREGRNLTAFTATPRQGFVERRGRFGDEWAHAAAVAGAHANIDHVRIANDDRPLIDVIDDSAASLPVPVLNPSNMVWVSAIDRAARDRGIGVMLTGQWGNMSVSYDGHLLPRLYFRTGRPDRTVATLWAMRRAQGWRWWTLLGALADATLPAPARRRLRAALGRAEPALSDYSAIHPALLAAQSEGEAWHHYAGNLGNLHPDDSVARRLAMLARSDVRGDYAAATRRRYGIDTVDPTLDRRVVELCLGIPEEQYCLNGVPRSLARRALAGVLPAQVLHERRRGLQAADWAMGFGAAIPAFRAELARLRASRAAPGWLDLDRIEQLLAGWPRPDAPTREIEHAALLVARGLATGRFVRAIEGGNA